MIKARLFGALAVATLAGPVVARAYEGPASTPMTYLPAGGLDVIPVLQPAPVIGDVRYEADREIFRRTRALKDTPRWKLATSDVSEKPADMLDDFSCAVGIRLSPERNRKLTQLLIAASADTARVNNAAKEYFHRRRPFTIDPGPICQPAADVLNSYDYPSGHTTRGWTWALILAQLIPERASAILARGRAYGESRIVCGVHNASAVEAGRLSANASMTIIENSPLFQETLSAARNELIHSEILKGRAAEACTRDREVLASAVAK